MILFSLKTLKNIKYHIFFLNELSYWINKSLYTTIYFIIQKGK